MNFIVSIGSALLKEPGYGDEPQLTRQCTEPRRWCVISFAQVAAFEAKSVIKKK